MNWPIEWYRRRTTGFTPPVLKLAEALPGTPKPRKRDAVFGLVLPWPPTVNHAYRPGEAFGHRFLTDEQKSFRRTVAQIMMVAKAKPLHGRLALSIVAVPPDNRRRDLSNLIKAVEDALQHAGLFADDEQIDHIELSRVRHPPSLNPMLKGTIAVSVREL
jgi:crossover junction endodeoxyribonuclease RusA